MPDQVQASKNVTHYETDTNVPKLYDLRGGYG